jgi:Cu2+-exporting ATPase
MDRALASKPRLASLADRAAAHFVFALLLVTAASAAVWWFIDATRVLPVIIALLVVTCPCALSLATPVALAAATGNLSRKGIVITRGHALEALAKATDVVFDKTGTITRGHMSLIGVLVMGRLSSDAAIATAASLESASGHPVARALVEAGCNLEKTPVGALRHTTGKGMEGIVDGQRLRIGSPEFVAELTGVAPPLELAFVSDEVTTVALGGEGEWLALFTLGDVMRPDAKYVVESLSSLGTAVHLLSGDRTPCVARVATRLGIAFFSGNATPAGKLDYVRKLQAQGAVVAAVGDGVNDTPLLAQAQVSIAMASGTDVARLNADVALLTDHIEPVLTAINVSRRTLRIIHQNLLWAVAYNVVAVPLAVLGLVTPLVAAIGMSASSLLVLGNSLRLRDSLTSAASRE